MVIEYLTKFGEQLEAYENRKFSNPHIIKSHYSCFNNYKHIKQNTKKYLVFDIDKIDPKKVELLFWNDFFTPNFYIYEYSKTKHCYTLQVFVLLNKVFRPDSIKTDYKKLCMLFGADTCYQIKTGIHKNPEFFEFINLDEYSFTIPQKNHCGFLHNRLHSFQNFMQHFEDFGYLNDINDNVDYEIDADDLDQMDLFDLDSEIKTPKNDVNIEIAALYETPNPIKTTKKNTGFRNNTLFEKVRQIAYSISNQSLENILHIANKVNTEFEIPLTQNEVKATAKSIHKFITEQFKNEKCDPYSDIQRAKSIQTRNEKAVKRIISAIYKLYLNKKNITYSAIKKITQQNINTIKNNFEAAMQRAYKLDKNIYDFMHPEKVEKDQAKFEKRFERTLRTGKPFRPRKAKATPKQAPKKQPPRLRLDDL